MSFLANVWTDAAAQGDTIVFSYSTDDQNYTEMFIVSADYDDDSYQAYSLPDNFTGTVYIRAEDTVRTRGVYDRSTLYVDHLFIRINNEPGTLPASPTDLAADAVSYDSISLVWTDNADNELGFSIERSLDGSSGWEEVGTTNADTANYVDSGLTADTMYYYRILAFNGTGDSDNSNIASAKTLLFQGNAMHISSLTGSAAQKHSRWVAGVTVTVIDQNESPVKGATVQGSWDIGGSGSCVTDGSGACTVTMTRIRTSVSGATFTVNNVSLSGYIYDADSNVVDSVEVLSP